MQSEGLPGLLYAGRPLVAECRDLRRIADQSVECYRLLKAFRQWGKAALSDGRHGHPSKLRGAARAFLEERCRQAPQTPSSIIQMELQEHFDLSVSISQINRVRVALGVNFGIKLLEFP